MKIVNKYVKKILMIKTSGSLIFCSDSHSHWQYSIFTCCHLLLSIL